MFLIGPFEVRREACASRPLAVFTLQCEQPGAPSFGGDARALRRDDFCWGMDKIAQHLPANGGVGIEQPSLYGHAGLAVRAIVSSARFAGSASFARSRTR